jgi:hypothetical protein
MDKDVSKSDDGSQIGNCGRDCGIHACEARQSFSDNAEGTFDRISKHGVPLIFREIDLGGKIGDVSGGMFYVV